MKNTYIVNKKKGPYKTISSALDIAIENSLILIC